MLLRNAWPDLWIGVQSPNSCQVDIARDEADTQLPVQAERLQALDEHASLMKVRGCIPVICNAQAVSRFDERFHHTHTVSAWTQNELLASAHVFPLNTCKVHSSTVEHPEQACSTATANTACRCPTPIEQYWRHKHYADLSTSPKACH